MSEVALRSVIEKMESDEKFRKAVESDANAAIADYDLSAPERAALAYNDEDALRRLLGAETVGFNFSPMLSPTNNQVNRASAGFICLNITQQTVSNQPSNPPCWHVVC